MTHLGRILVFPLQILLAILLALVVLIADKLEQFARRGDTATVAHVHEFKVVGYDDPPEMIADHFNHAFGFALLKHVKGLLMGKGFETDDIDPESVSYSLLATRNNITYCTYCLAAWIWPPETSSPDGARDGHVSIDVFDTRGFWSRCRGIAPPPAITDTDGPRLVATCLASTPGVRDIKANTNWWQNDTNLTKDALT